jgi:hypothetical protein
MSGRSVRSLALASLALAALAGCATPEQWATWRSHSSHFASGRHASFSLWNQGPEAERVRATDVETAQDQRWWGKQLPVASR